MREPGTIDVEATEVVKKVEEKAEDMRPQCVKDIENEPETIELLVHPRGYTYAQATWRDKKFSLPLPKGIENLPDEKGKAIIKEAAIKLKKQVARAKWLAMSDAAAEHVRELKKSLDARCEPSDKDKEKLAAAEAKRQRRLNQISEQSSNRSLKVVN